MTLTTSMLDNLTLTVVQEIRVRAPIDITFAALIEQIGVHNEHPDGTPMHMKLEPWPGGRWFRDLGDSNGHLENGVTLIKFRHSGFGLIQDEHKAGVVAGWTSMHDKVRQRAETGRSKSAVQ